MDITLTDTPSLTDEQTVIDNLWAHNHTIEPVHLHPLQVTLRNAQGDITAGLVARTWWGTLDIQYLWVQEADRKTGIGTQLMLAAEEEAIRRGCHMASVDTFSFQAQGFYHKLGYETYGQLTGYAGQHTRIYMAKKLG